MRKNWDSYAGVGIQGESLPYDDQYVDLDPTYRDRFGFPLLRITFDWHENDYNLIRYLSPKMREILEKMGAKNITTEKELQPYSIAPYQSTHCTGGAIMGTDPSNSVVNKYGQVWDTPNCFVVGASQFPQNAGMNPTGTVAALAYMAGDGHRRSLHEGSGEDHRLIVGTFPLIPSPSPRARGEGSQKPLSHRNGIGYPLGGVGVV